jgi:hypothetical protein
MTVCSPSSAGHLQLQRRGSNFSRRDTQQARDAWLDRATSLATGARSACPPAGLSHCSVTTSSAGWRTPCRVAAPKGVCRHRSCVAMRSGCSVHLTALSLAGRSRGARISALLRVRSLLRGSYFAMPIQRTRPVVGSVLASCLRLRRRRMAALRLRRGMDAGS